MKEHLCDKCNRSWWHVWSCQQPDTTTLECIGCSNSLVSRDDLKEGRNWGYEDSFTRSVREIRKEAGIDEES